MSQRGQKHNDDIKEKAFAMLTECNNVSEVARRLGLKPSTVQTWKKQWEKEAEDGVDNSIVKLREDKKKEFVDDAWSIIGKAQTLLERRLTRAIYSEDEIDKMIQVVVQDKDLTDESKKALLAKLRTIRVDDIREIATVLGTIYDKQALANKEATAIVEGGIQVEFNIPRPPKDDE